MDKKQFFEFQSRMDAMKAVIKLNNPKKFEELSKEDDFWAPEISPRRYSEWVNANYEVNPNDIVSLIVYSLLMNMPIEQLREKMIADFGNEPKKKIEFQLIIKANNYDDYGIIFQNRLFLCLNLILQYHHLLKHYIHTYH